MYGFVFYKGKFSTNISFNTVSVFSFIGDPHGVHVGTFNGVPQVPQIVLISSYPSGWIVGIALSLSLLIFFSFCLFKFAIELLL